MDKPEYQEAVEHCQKLMARGFAHQIKNPLQALQLGLDHLQSQDEMQPHASVLKEMARAIERLDSVTQGILSITHSLARPREFDLVQLLKEVTGEYAQQLQDGRIDLQCDLPGTLLVEADDRQIQQAMNDVLDNALAASPPGSRLLIRLGSESGNVRLLIRNSDARISEADLEHVFEPFFTTARAGEGNGLGLNRVQKVMSLHRGQVTLSNNGDEGVDCLLILPREAK